MPILPVTSGNELVLEVTISETRHAFAGQPLNHSQDGQCVRYGRRRIALMTIALITTSEQVTDKSVPYNFNPRKPGLP